MKKLLLSLGLLTAATAATAQEARPAGLFNRRGAAPSAVPARASRPVAWPTSRPLAQPERARPTERLVDVVGVVADAVAVVQLGRYVWANGLPEAPPPAYYRPVRRASAPSATSARFGLKAGLNIATVTGETGADLAHVAGFNGGVMADFGLGEHFSLHPELLYSQKGSKGTATAPLGLGLTFSSRERLHYLDLPLLLRARASGFFAEAGPQLGYMVANKAETTISVPGLSPETQTDTSFDGVQRFDVGYVLGLGYALPQGLELGLRYNGGFTDLQNPSTDPKLRNSVFQVQVGYLF